MTELVQSFLDALQLRDWYAVAALALTVAIQVLRKWPALSERVWRRIPDGARFLVPTVSGAALAFVAAYSEGKVLTEALMAAVGGALTIGLGSMGAAAALKESPVKWDGGKGGKDDDDPPTGSKPAGLAMMMLAVSLLGCAAGTNDKPPCDSNTAAKMAAECALRTELECVQAGLPEEGCHVIRECKAAAEKRERECLK